MKKIFSAIALLLIVPFALCACGVNQSRHIQNDTADDVKSALPEGILLPDIAHIIDLHNLGAEYFLVTDYTLENEVANKRTANIGYEIKLSRPKSFTIALRGVLESDEQKYDFFFDQYDALGTERICEITRVDYIEKLTDSQNRIGITPDIKMVYYYQIIGGVRYSAGITLHDAAATAEWVSIAEAFFASLAAKDYICERSIAQ